MSVEDNLPDNYPELGLACLRCGDVVPPGEACEGCAQELVAAIGCVDDAAQGAREKLRAGNPTAAAILLERAAIEIEFIR